MLDLPQGPISSISIIIILLKEAFMGKFISRRDFLKGTAAAGLGAAAFGLFGFSAGAEESTTEGKADKYTPGTYSDTEETQYSTITVTMTFSSTEITDCVIESEGDSDLLTDDIKAEMGAAIVECRLSG